jgi:hypothetical protein
VFSEFHLATSSPARPGRREEIGMNRLWGPEEVAQYLDVPVQTVDQWRCTDYGPRGITVGRCGKYRPDDVTGWVVSLVKTVA